MSSRIIRKTRKALRREAEAERQAKLREWQIQIHLDGTRDKVLAETGVDLLAGTEWGAPLPPIPSADGGEGRDAINEGGAFDSRSSSQTLSDHIRDVLSDPDRQVERRRLKHGGSPDAKDVPEDAPAATSFPEVPWERGL